MYGDDRYEIIQNIGYFTMWILLENEFDTNKITSARDNIFVF